MKIKLIGLNWRDNKTPVKWESEDGKYELRLRGLNKISESVLEDETKNLKLTAHVDYAINPNDKFECDIYRRNITGDVHITSITFDANRVTQLKSSLKSGSSLRSTGFSQNGTPSKKGVGISLEGIKANDNDGKNDNSFEQYFFSLARNSGVEKWKNAVDMEEICNIIRGDENFKKILDGYLNRDLALNKLGEKAFGGQFKQYLSFPDGQESQAACLLYMYLVITGRRLDKVITFEKNNNNQWITRDGYLLSVDGSNVISVDFSLLCKMAKSNFVILYGPNGNSINGVCNFYDGSKKLGVITFEQKGTHVSNFTVVDNKYEDQIEFYDSVKEWFGEESLYTKIKNCNGDISLLVRDPQIESIIREAGLDPSSGSYSDYADAILKLDKQRNEEIKARRAQEKLVAIFKDGRWILVDAETQRQKRGGIYWRNRPLEGVWPAPTFFSDQFLEAKRDDESPVSGSIHFKYNGIDWGTLKFYETGIFESVEEKNNSLNSQDELGVRFREVFYEKVEKSEEKDWKRITSIPKICDIIYPNLKNIDGFKGYLNSDGVLNGLGEDTFDEEIGVVIPRGYEKEAACLLYIHLLNEKSLNSTEVPSNNFGGQKFNLDLNNQTNQGNNTINDQVRGIFSRENGIWIGQKNGEKYIMSLDGKKPLTVFPAALLYNLAEDKLLKLYDQRGSLVSGTFDVEMGSNRGFIGSITFNNGVVTSHGIIHYASNGSVSKYEKIKNYSIRKNIDYKKEMIKYNGDAEKMYDMFSERYGQDFNQKVLEFKCHNVYGWSAENGHYYISVNGGESPVFGSITVLEKLIKDGFAKLYRSGKSLMDGICRFFKYGEVTFGKDGKAVKSTIKGIENVKDEGRSKFYESAKRLLGFDLFEDAIKKCNGSMSQLLDNEKISEVIKNLKPGDYNKFAEGIEYYLSTGEIPKLADLQQQNQEDVQYDYQQSAQNNFQQNNFYQQNQNFNPGILNFECTPFDGWAAYTANGLYSISVNGQPMHESYNIMREMITDGFARLYGPDGGIAGGTCQFVDSNGKKLGYVVFSNDGRVTGEDSRVYTKSLDGGKVGFYDSAKELLGPLNFRNEIIACNGSMDVLSRNNYKISSIIKNLKPGDYNEFYKAIENYLSTGNIPQQESAGQSKVPELKEVGGKLVVKGTDFEGTVETIPDMKNIVVEDPFIFIKMLNDRIIKIRGAGGQRISYSGYNFTLDSYGFLSKKEDDCDGGVMPIVNTQGAANKYDSVKKYYDRMNMDFENSILKAEGNLQSLIDKIKLQDDKNDKKSEDEKLENKFIQQSIDEIKKRAVPAKLLTPGEGEKSYKSVDDLISDFYIDEETKKKIYGLGSEEKKINAIKRLLLRIENGRANYKKRSLLGKMLHRKEKNANVTSKKINSCFKSVAKYIVKCIEYPSLLKCQSLLNNFKPMSGKSKWEPWYRGFKDIMIDDNIKKYAVSYANVSDSDCIKAVIGMLFVSMVGLNRAESVICACDALKNGGINSKDKSEILVYANEIRKAIKAKCSGRVERDALKNYIRKLCVNDYRFITKAGFDDTIKSQKYETTEGVSWRMVWESKK